MANSWNEDWGDMGTFKVIPVPAPVQSMPFKMSKNQSLITQRHAPRAQSRQTLNPKPYMQIARGVDECGIESNVVAGLVSKASPKFA